MTPNDRVPALVSCARLTYIKIRAAPYAMLRSMTKRLARFMFLALGLIAVSALLAQPICEAAERQSVGHEGDSYCCPVVAPEALAAAAPLLGGPSILAVAPAIASPVLRPRIVISGLPASAAAPPLVSGYYVRSARIQR
jgi:hypothetical protein